MFKILFSVDQGSDLFYFSFIMYQLFDKVFLKLIRYVYYVFKEFCRVGISYKMFENIGDMCYRFCNNSDMYVSDLKNQFLRISLCVFKILRGFMK